MERIASCACGQLRLRVHGDPTRVVNCHCLQCQRRTGSVFGVGAIFRRSDIVQMVGTAKKFTRQSERNTAVTFSFCPECGTSVYWEPSADPDIVMLAVGAFADPSFPPPERSVFCMTQHPWVKNPEGAEAYLGYSQGQRA